MFDRKTAETYNDGTTYHYVYDAEGDLAQQYATDADGAKTEQYDYQYDSLGRLIHSRETDGAGNMVQRTEHLYDTSNRLTAQRWQFSNGASFEQTYTYSSKDDTLTTVKNTTPVSSFSPTVTYTYNTLRQLTRKTTDNVFYHIRIYVKCKFSPPESPSIRKNRSAKWHSGFGLEISSSAYSCSCARLPTSCGA